MSSNEALEKEICSICLGEVENRGKISCDHAFCFDCIKKWSEVTNLCPTCKKPFTKITAVDTPKKRGEKRKASSQKAVKVSKRRIGSQIAVWLHSLYSRKLFFSMRLFSI